MRYSLLSVAKELIEIKRIYVNTRGALGGAHLPPTKVFRRLTGSVNKTILKALLAAAAYRPTYTSDFPDVKFRVEALK